MTYIRDVHDYSNEECEAKGAEFVLGRNKKPIKDAIEELINAEFDRLEEYAGEFLSQVAARRAEAFLEKVLQGDADAAKQLIGWEGDRYHHGKPWAHVIHGKLSMTDTMRLRQQIVEAHADLIRDERIKDLESIVEGLKQQVIQVTAENGRLLGR